MHILQHIKAIYFKNHTQLELDFHPRIHCLVGKNGCGKTNILDAIYYLCFARSYFSKTDKMLQLQSNSGFSVNGVFKKEELISVSCIYREDGKKELVYNGEMIGKTSAFIGKNSCVIIAPDDISIINEGSENRRRWLDSMFCQIDSTYLQQLQIYQKVLLQRNALLKAMLEKNERTNTVLEYYNTQLAESGSFIFKYRKKHWQTLQQKIVEKYTWIADANDAIAITYQSTLEDDDLKKTLELNIHKDLVTQRTNYGIHKDDLVFTMQKEGLKNIASQGQKKSFLLALKIAELEWLASQKGIFPILLLDDIFERLDNSRIQNLFSYISNTLTSQVIMTDTNKDRMEKCLKEFTNNFAITALD